MNIQPRESSTEGEDCFTLCVSSILNYKEFSPFLAVWKQCGLLYSEDPERGNPKLAPSYMTVEQELRHIHRIDLQIRREHDQTDVVKQIMTHLHQNEPVIVWVDVFYLQYNSLYQVMHSAHCIVLSEYADGKFVFIDDFYHLKGSMDEQDLIQALDLGMTPLIREGTRFRYATLDITDAVRKVPERDFYAMLHHNQTILGGESEELRSQSGWQELVRPLAGIAAIERYVQSTRSYMEHVTELTEEFLDNMYSDLAGISNNRYLYGHFLREGIPYDPELSKLIDNYDYAAQRWNLAANMTLKSLYQNVDRRHQMLNRALGKVQEIIAIEHQACEMGKSLVANSGFSMMS